MNLLSLLINLKASLLIKAYILFKKKKKKKIYYIYIYIYKLTTNFWTVVYLRIGCYAFDSITNSIFYLNF